MLEVFIAVIGILIVFNLGFAMGRRLGAKEGIDYSKDHWIDDADHYICPICGFETSSPAKYEGCKCPNCGFQDDKDKQLVR